MDNDSTTEPTFGIVYSLRGDKTRALFMFPEGTTPQARASASGQPETYVGGGKWISSPEIWAEVGIPSNRNIEFLSRDDPDTKDIVDMAVRSLDEKFKRWDDDRGIGS